VGGFPETLLVDGKPATPRILSVDPNSDKTNPRLTIASLTMYVIRRGERYALRIKDSQSEALTGFHGLNWYEPNPKYRLTARWLPYKPPRTTSLSTLIGTHYSQPVPGVAEFEVDGKTYRLEPVIEDPEEEKLFFILRDTTSKSTTYAACRFLYTPYPDQGLANPGPLVLDFNKIETRLALTRLLTCPLPPPGIVTNSHSAGEAVSHRRVAGVCRKTFDLPRFAANRHGAGGRGIDRRAVFHQSGSWGNNWSRSPRNGFVESWCRNAGTAACIVREQPCPRGKP
jgi:uncharacterized protein (DUF1684 family)